MEPQELLSALENSLKATDETDLVCEHDRILEGLDGSEKNFPLVRTVLGFMESNPDRELGTPGPLVHFIERFYGRGYETEVVQSLSRRPTPHTVWLLNRMINGEKDPIVLAGYIRLMVKISQDSDQQEVVRRTASDFLEYISTWAEGG